ncbi:MAG: TIGR02710 family CRISPR-associated CARF protein [Thiotrichales bacterium]
MTPTVLIVTVGGSHQPITTSINELGPIYVCFLCTDRDPGTGQPGSRTQVEGKGNVIKASHADKAPSLPNLPTQCGLTETAFELCLVPADDLDGVVHKALAVFSSLRSRFPDARLVADYTGGTKTMTAGLSIAALERSDVELRLVTGARANLQQVHDGTQSGTAAVAEQIRLRRLMAPSLFLWSQYGYGAAAVGLSRISPPHDPLLRAEWQIARDLSLAFDAWDRFDHLEARKLLELYQPRIGEKAGLLIAFLKTLCLDKADKRNEPARLIDLWLNAKRRAAQRRYDDAVARAYRLLEWSAQWLLRTRADIDTSNVPENRLPPEIALKPGRDGKRQAGLFDGWRLVANLLEGATAEFARNEAETLLDHLRARNHSILAHGFTPIDEAMWNRFENWLESNFIPVLRQAAAHDGFRMEAPQLPDQPIWSRSDA